MRNLSKRWQLEASDRDRHALTKLARSSNRHEADRARAILAVLDGMTSTLIAEILRVSPEQVRRWRGRFIRGGVAALHGRPHPGRPARKADQALTCIQHVLAQPAPPGVVWTVARLRDEVLRRTGISISKGWLGTVMRKKGGCAGGGRDIR